MSLAAIDNRLAVHPYYGSTIPPYLRNTDQVSSPRPACRAAGPGPFFYSPGCDRACCYRSLPRRHRPGRRASARRAGGPSRAAPPERRHRHGDRAARCGRRPGRAPGRRAGSPGRHLASAITRGPFWHTPVALQYGCLRSRKAVTPIKSPVPSPAPGAGYWSPALPPWAGLPDGPRP